MSSVKKFFIAVLLSILLAPELAIGASLREEFQAQTYFRPGNIAREQFDFSLFRQERRARWGVRKVRGFSLGTMEDVPLIPTATEAEVPTTVPLVEGTPHPQRWDKPSFTLSQRERVRSYVRRGGCPEGLPPHYTLACRQALEERQKQHPSTEYLLRRAKNPKQDLRKETNQFTLLDRLRMVAPRPRSVMERGSPALGGAARFRLFDLSQ